MVRKVYLKEREKDIKILHCLARHFVNLNHRLWYGIPSYLNACVALKWKQPCTLSVLHPCKFSNFLYSADLAYSLTIFSATAIAAVHYM